MRFHLDHRTGTLAVAPGERWTHLRRPTLREWCDWLDEHERPFDRLPFATTIGGIEDAMLSSNAGPLNAFMLSRLSDGALTFGCRSPEWLPLCNRQLTDQLLAYWRDYPLSPWALKLEDLPPKPGRRPMKSNLAGGVGARAVLYRSLVRVANPLEVDAMDLTQIAMLLGVDDPDRDLEPEESGEEHRGGRIARGSDGQVQRMSFRRRPGTPYRFSSYRRDSVPA